MDIENYAHYTAHFYSDYVPELLERTLNKYTFSSILDCGCGDGSLLFALRERKILEGKEAYGIDFSESRVNIARENIQGVEFFVDNSEELKNIKNDSIDFFISTQVIEHVDDEKMVKTMSRVMKNDGIAFISTVFKKPYAWYFYRCNGKRVLDPTHLREYTKEEELFDIFTKNGFEILEERKRLFYFPLVDFILNRLTFINRKTGNKSFIKNLRKIKIPILGYYIWEIILKKK